MSPLFTLLACLSEDGSHYLCPNFNSSFPRDSFWNYLFPEGLITYFIIAALGMVIIIIVRGLSRLFNTKYPVIPRTWWPYFWLAVISAMLTGAMYSMYLNVSQCLY